MNLTMPPTDKEMHVNAIKRAMDSKASEVEVAQRKLTDLQAELRGLQIALRAINGEPTPRS